MLTKKNKLSQIKTKYFHRVKPQSRENKFSLKLTVLLASNSHRFRGISLSVLMYSHPSLASEHLSNSAFSLSLSQ